MTPTDKLSEIKEGQTATNQKTGATLTFRGGQWQ